MEKESYRIPSKPLDCFEVSNTVLRMITESGEKWGVPRSVTTDFTTVMADYNSNYQVANNRSTQSPGATAARNASWSPVKVQLTEIYNNYFLNNPAISVSDKEILGINIINQGGKAPFPAPTSTPNVTLSSEQISILYVVFSDSATPNSHAKPEGVAFCEICYKIDGVAPVTPEECPLNKYISRSHEPLVFEPSQRGKVVYLYARWVNRNSKTGPWSGVFTSIIP